MLLSLVFQIVCWAVSDFVLNVTYKQTSPCTYVSCLKHGSRGEFLICLAKNTACSHHVRIFFATEVLALSVMDPMLGLTGSSGSGWSRLMHLIRNLLMLLTKGLPDIGVRSSVLHDAWVVARVSGLYLRSLSLCKMCFIP